MKLRFIISILLVLINNISFSQNCVCTEINDTAVIRGKDSTIAPQLMQSSNAICKAKACYILGCLKIDKGQLDSAEYLLRKAEEFYKTTDCNNTFLIGVYGNLSDIYYRKGNYPESLDWCYKLLQTAEKSNDVYQVAISNTMVAQLFFEINQTEKGLAYIRKAALLYNKLKKFDEKERILYALLKRYMWHYDMVKDNTSLDTSELYCRKLLQLAREGKDNIHIARAFNGLQEVAYERNQLNLAIQFLDSAIQYTNKNDYEDIGIIYNDKAEILLEQKKYKEALMYADSSLDLDKITGNSADMASTYLLFTKIYKEMNDYKKAYEYNELGRNILDSINNIKSRNDVTELEKKYNQQKNELTIADLQKKKQLYLLLSVLALFGVAIATLIYRQKSLKQKQHALEIEQRLNRARMNPHFFFNSLAALQKFALKENNNLTLAGSLAKYSKLMRATLESTYKEYISIEDEISFLNEYLQVQQVRFEKPIEFNISCDDEIETDEVLIPSMIIQPFLENTIEHGFLNINYTGNIEVRFMQQNGKLVIEVKDNGTGIDAAKKKDGHISRATQIINDRIYLLNLKHQSSASFIVKNNPGNKGAIVRIYLPVLYQNNI